MDFVSLRALVASIAFCILQSSPALAEVVDAADINIEGRSYATFVDQASAVKWLDLSNFWDDSSTYQSVVRLLDGSGFHIATLFELNALQTSTPGVPELFVHDSVVMGGNYVGNPHPGQDREIIWGIYDDGNSSDGVSYSWKNGPLSNSTYLEWQYFSNALDTESTLRSQAPNNQDLGVWIVSDESSPMIKSSPRLVVDEGVLLGADEISVGGVLYDVRFVDGSCTSLFDGCVNPEDFTFSSQTDAWLAAQLLLDLVLRDTLIGEFDTLPSLTNGCSAAGSSCIIWTPYNVADSSAGSVGTVEVTNLPSPVDPGIQSTRRDREWDLTPYPTLVYAVWSPSQAITRSSVLRLIILLKADEK